MNFLKLLFAIMPLTVNAFAFECVDFSGTYLEQSENIRVTLVQEACKKIDVTIFFSNGATLDGEWMVDGVERMIEKDHWTLWQRSQWSADEKSIQHDTKVHSSFSNHTSLQSEKYSLDESRNLVIERRIMDIDGNLTQGPFRFLLVRQ